MTNKQQPDWADELAGRIDKWTRDVYDLLTIKERRDKIAAMIREARPDASPAVAFTREDVETARTLSGFLDGIQNARVGYGIGGQCYCPGPRNKSRIDELAKQARAFAAKIERTLEDKA